MFIDDVIMGAVFLNNVLVFINSNDKLEHRDLFNDFRSFKVENSKRFWDWDQNLAW